MDKYLNELESPNEKSSHILDENKKIKILDGTKRVKLDIGLSYSAPHSHSWLKNENDLMVFGFEPHPGNIESIKKGSIKRDISHGETLDIKFINDDKFKLIPCALGSEIKDTTLYMTKEDSGCSSIHEPIHFTLEDKTNVKMFTLKSFFNLFPWDKIQFIDYIKIDAQGNDLDIIKGAEHYLSEKVVFITAEPEVNHYKNVTNSESEIDDYMKSIGFVKINNKNLFPNCYSIDPTYININFLQYPFIYNINYFQMS
jgi:FkbM family methyltransferase